MNADDRIMHALIHQVARAVPAGGTDQDVTTIISTPMWAAWCRAVGKPEDSEPTEWGTGPNHNRVYGSRTLVVDHPKMLAVSGVLASTAKYLP